MAGVGVSGSTLQQAIREKYSAEAEPSGEVGVKSIQSRSFEVGLAYRPGSCPVHKLTSILLDNKEVCEVDENESLSALCPSVQEMHLCNNSISHWKDVSVMLRSLPALTLLNLGHNPLGPGTFMAAPTQTLCESLSTLVLNGTKIDWQALQVLLKAVPRLLELHLSMNGYGTVNLAEDFQHRAVRHLHFNDNKIERWEEIAKLSSVFPGLQRLIAASNPITAIPNDLDSSSVFTELLVLNLNNSALSSWDSIESLHVLRMLRELSILKIPLGEQMDTTKRRKAFVARLPNLNMLNKTTITDSERETSERWLIRELRDMPDPPAIYHELIKKHGNLRPLADINLAPVNTVSMEFHFIGMDREAEIQDVRLNQTVQEFKKWVSKTLLGRFPIHSFQLYYVDKCLQYEGGVCLKNNNKKLYAYRMNDGDEIQVELKI